MQSTIEKIQRSMALAFFGCAYADQAEESGNALAGEIMDQLPDEIDPAAIHAAKTLMSDMANANMASVDALYIQAEECETDGGDRELTPELFGHYCAMQAMGTGVGLESFGSAIRDAIHVPYVEFGSHSLERDYFNEDCGED